MQTNVYIHMMYIHMMYMNTQNSQMETVAETHFKNLTQSLPVLVEQAVAKALARPLSTAVRRKCIASEPIYWCVRVYIYTIYENEICISYIYIRFMASFCKVSFCQRATNYKIYMIHEDEGF